jgi:hypothetical protein
MGIMASNGNGQWKNDEDNTRHNVADVEFGANPGMGGIMIEYSRRLFVAGAASVGAFGAALLRPASAHATPLGLPIGLELYSVGPEIDKDVEVTLRSVAAIGYREVESARRAALPVAMVSAFDRPGEWHVR